MREMCSAASRHTDPSQAIAAVRAVRRRELFRVAAADVFGLLDVEQVAAAISDIARATLEAGLTAAERAITAERRTGLPTRIAVVALGRLGGREMSYASDADVLFVHQPEPGADEKDAHDCAFAVANELRRLLALPGADPPLVLDADLRPEGRQGPLVRTLASYAAYYQRWSKVWEAQALLRACPVAGDAALAAAFMALVDPLRYPAGGLSDADIAEVRRIKARVDAERLPRGASSATHLKLGRGGIADVEWTVQLMQMRFGHESAALRTTQTLPALASAVADGLITSVQAEAVASAWRLASRIRNASMLVRGRPSDSLPRQARDRVGVAFLCGYGTDQASRLLDDYQRTARRASVVVRQVFWS
jgi:glutamate-ammonia-ligase adenylyltransferase